MAARMTPLGALTRGLVAGAVGTGAMTVHQELRRRMRQSRSHEGSSNGGGEQRDPWESAPAPAVVARRVIEGIFGREVGPEKIGLLSNVMHWAYGIGWGGVYGLVEGTADAGPIASGAAFGTGVWAASYAELVPMGLYEPPWEYPPETLANDLGYHLTYGVGTGLAFAAVRPSA